MRIYENIFLISFVDSSVIRSFASGLVLLEFFSLIGSFHKSIGVENIHFGLRLHISDRPRKSVRPRNSEVPLFIRRHRFHLGGIERQNFPVIVFQYYFHLDQIKIISAFVLEQAGCLGKAHPAGNFIIILIHDLQIRFFIILIELDPIRTVYRKIEGRGNGRRIDIALDDIFILSGEDIARAFPRGDDRPVRIFEIQSIIEILIAKSSVWISYLDIKIVFAGKAGRHYAHLPHHQLLRRHATTLLTDVAAIHSFFSLIFDPVRTSRHVTESGIDAPDDEEKNGQIDRTDYDSLTFRLVHLIKD